MYNMYILSVRGGEQVGEDQGILSEKNNYVLRKLNLYSYSEVFTVAKRVYLVSLLACPLEFCWY